MAEDLTGFQPPEEDQTIVPGQPALPGQVQRGVESWNNWKQRFDYALAVMGGQHPSSYLDQLGTHEFLGEQAGEAAQYVLPGRRFPITALRPGAVLAPGNVIPFAKPLEVIAKDKLLPPEPANVNVDVTKGWDTVPYTNKAGQEESHHFLFDTAGRPVSVVTPVGPIEGVTQKGKGGWGISFLEPKTLGEGNIPKFVGDHYVLDDLNKAKQFAAESVQSGEFASFRQAYGDYLAAQAKRREGFVRDVSKPEPKAAVKEPPTLDELGKLLDDAIKASKDTYINKEGMIVDKVKEAEIDASWNRMVEASRAEDNKLIAASRIEDAKRIADLNAEELKFKDTETAKQASAFRTADAERRRGLFKEVEGGKKEGPERITDAVIKLEDGTMLKGYSHFDAMNKNWEKFSASNADKMEDGFLTSTGRYVDRHEAMDILKKSGQKTMGWSTEKTGVVSEDIVDLLSKENQKTLRDLGELPPSSPLNPPSKPLKLGESGEKSIFDYKQVRDFYSSIADVSGKVNEENWRKFIEAQPLSENIEDRRHENPYLNAAIVGLRNMMKNRERSDQEKRDLTDYNAKNGEFMKMDEEDFRKMKPI